MLTIRTRYSPVEDKGIKDWGQSKTQQHFANEVNIMEIMKRAKKGIMPIPSDKQGFYGDISTMEDYFNCQQTVLQANEQFMELDPEIRDRFENDPGLLLQFLENPKNVDEAIKLGLMVLREPVEVTKALPTDSDTKPAEAGKGTIPS